MSNNKQRRLRYLPPRMSPLARAWWSDMLHSFDHLVVRFDVITSMFGLVGVKTLMASCSTNFFMQVGIPLFELSSTQQRLYLDAAISHPVYATRGIKTRYIFTLYDSLYLMCNLSNWCFVKWINQMNRLLLHFHFMHLFFQTS